MPVGPVHCRIAKHARIFGESPRPDGPDKGDQVVSFVNFHSKIAMRERALSEAKMVKNGVCLEREKRQKLIFVSADAVCALRAASLENLRVPLTG